MMREKRPKASVGILVVFHYLSPTIEDKWLHDFSVFMLYLDNRSV